MRTYTTTFLSNGRPVAERRVLARSPEQATRCAIAQQVMTYPEVTWSRTRTEITTEKETR